MSDSSPKHAEFNWPPTDEELAECLYSGPPDEQVAQRGVQVLQETIADGTDFQAEPAMPTGLLAPLEASAGPLEPEASANTSSKSWDVEFDRPPDGARTSDWAAEITRLQALIEALTEKVG